MSKDSQRVEIRLPAKSKAKLLEIAEGKGGASKLIRTWIDASSPACQDGKIKGGAGVHNSIWHLSRIGNSLNQMAYVANKANLSGKINDKLIKEMIKELMYLNIKIDALIDKCDES